MSSGNPFSTLSNIRYILARILEFKPAVLGVMVVNILTSAINQVTPVFLPKLIIQEITVGKNPKNLFVLSAIFGLLMAVSGSLKSASGINLSAYFESLRLYVNMKSGEKYMKLSYENLEKPELMDAFERGTWAFNDYRTGVFGMISRVCQLSHSVISALLTSYALIILNPFYVLVTIGLLVLNSAVNTKIRRDEININRSLSRNARRLKNYVVQMINPAYGKDMRVYAMQDFILGKFRNEQKTRYESDRVINRKVMRGGFLTASVSLVQELMLYILLCKAAIARQISLAEFVMYVTALRVFVSALDSILDGLSFCRQQNESINYHRQFMDYEDSVSQGEPVDVAQFSAVHLEVRNVSFKYPGTDSWAVEDVSFEVCAGEKVALVGLNGAGKTTLIKLITRLYEPSRGEIVINGSPASKYSRDEYYKLFAPVFQDIHMFAFTVAENVSMQEYDLLDRGRVETALSQAGLNDKVLGLAKGIDTPVLRTIEPDGVDFSGGEVQRLAMARALYKNAPVVLLDEPTSALDPLTEERFYRRFGEYTKGKTVLFVSHRLSSTRFCDRIIVMEGGRLIEQGTHDELTASKGRYLELYEMQAKYYKDGSKQVLA